MKQNNNQATIVKTIRELSLRVYRSKSLEAIRELPLRIVRNGMLFAIGFFGTTILAVAISGTIKTWTTGEVLKSADLNTTIASLQTAIQNIPNLTKAANGNDAYYTAGNVGIGTATPASTLTVKGAGTTTGVNFQTQNSAGTALITGLDSGNVGIGTASPGAELQIVRSSQCNSTGCTASVQASNTNPTFENGTSNYNFSVLNARAGNNVVDGYLLAEYDGAFNGIQVGSASSSPVQIITGGTSKIHITSAGNVGIGTTVPTAALHVVGTTLAAVWSTSDERYKKNIQTIDSPMEKILKLRGVNYEWRQSEFKDLKFKSGKDIGFIGQEVEKVLPEVILKDDKGFISVAYSSLLPVVVEAFKELKKDHDLVKAEKAANEKKLLALEEDNKRLRDTVETLRATSLRASQQLEDRLRAIENTQMARK